MCLSVRSGKVDVLKCNDSLGADQVFMLTEANEIRIDMMCLTTFNKTGEFFKIDPCQQLHIQVFTYDNQVSCDHLLSN